MSTETPAPVDTPNEPVATPDDEPLREPGKRALVEERTRAAAAEKALADLRKEIEDSKKSNEQRASDDLAAAQSAAAQNAAKALRYEVAAAKGLDLSLAARLSGSTKEELEADADSLMALIPRPADIPRGPHVPSEGTRAGSDRGVSQLTDDDLKSMTPAQINEARRQGRLTNLLRLP